MATVPRPSHRRTVEYPTSDGKPMAETDVHRKDMVDLIESLTSYFAADPGVYVSGNLLLYYVEGDKRKHISPDVFVVKGTHKADRLHYLLWEEKRGPALVIELTSPSTRAEDQRKKLALYRDILKVPEYFMFDPLQQYLKPSLQGYRLIDGVYVPITPVDGRIPSEELGLHLERDGQKLRLFDPTQGRWIPTMEEVVAAESEARRNAEAEIERLRRELEALKNSR